MIDSCPPFSPLSFALPWFRWNTQRLLLSMLTTKSQSMLQSHVIKSFCSLELSVESKNGMTIVISKSRIIMTSDFSFLPLAPRWRRCGIRCRNFQFVEKRSRCAPCHHRRRTEHSRRTCTISYGDAADLVAVWGVMMMFSSSLRKFWFCRLSFYRSRRYCIEDCHVLNFTYCNLLPK